MSKSKSTDDEDNNSAIGIALGTSIGIALGLTIGGFLVAVRSRR